MAKVFVAGYLVGKKWAPLTTDGEVFPEEVKCKEAFLEDGVITPSKGSIIIDADKCFYARSARGAKNKYTSQLFHNHAIAYTDGSYNKNTGRYGYGVYMEIGDTRSEYYGGAQDTTGGWQVNGELHGALFAIEKAIEAGCDSVEIRYDYEGVHKWADGMWNTNKNYTARYKQKIQEYRNQIDISFVHIKSHTGNTGNERADDLAKKGAGLEEPLPCLNKIAIGEEVNPTCRKALLAFQKKSKHTFRDFMNLKTGGMDAYSHMGTEKLRKYAEEKNIDLSGSLPEEKAQMTAIRWIMRGLSVDDAVHKVKVDAEVSANAINSRW